MTAIRISCAKVTSINQHGFWLQCNGEELHLPFVEFPWFEHATIAQICRVNCPSANRVYWPDLDLDFTLDAIRFPMAFSHAALSSDC